MVTGHIGRIGQILRSVALYYTRTDLNGSMESVLSVLPVLSN